MLETAWESRWLPDFYGGIAQLGEHLPCKQGVKGSNPFISIRYKTIPKEPDKQGSKKYMSCIKVRACTLKTAY